MKTKFTHTRKLLLGTILALATPFALPTAARAADHGDGPTASNDQSCDIADVFFFVDPNDATKAVLIATFRGFIVPSEAGNFGIFDPTVRYRFLIENTNDAVADKTIDVSFTRKLAGGTPQTAAIRISGTPGALTAPSTNSTLNDTANAQTLTSIGTGISFFAGEVDDPFFFDIVGFNRAVAALTATPPNPGAAVAALGRARDSFAGYNIMAIALSVPITQLKVAGGTNTIGLSFEAQRHVVETPGLDGETIVGGGYRTIDRTGVPAVNVALVPFSLKNRYNAGSTLQDSQGRFATSIVGTITAVMTGLGKTPTEIGAAVGTLASVAVSKGDMLRLNTSLPNAGTGGGTGANGFPNGRRLADDTIDIILSILNSGGALGDGVNASDVPLTNSFPFLALPQQPRANGVIDDNTRN